VETTPISASPQPSLRGSVGEVFAAFARLGVSAFGGPIAHLGYFREEFVVRRRWMDEASYADLVALCQFLPGPASSQVGFAIGLMRAGWPGALAAWIGFTLPSAILLTAFALSAAALEGQVAQGVIHGFKIVAVAVVAQAVVAMARTLTPDATRVAIAVAAAATVALTNAMIGQIAAITLGAFAGYFLCRGAIIGTAAVHPTRVSRRTGIAALAAFVVMLIVAPILAAVTGDPTVEKFDAFYRSGALVFGGGHVVLPMLQQAVVEPGWVGQDAFLAGYGAAQAVPGPLFTFAAYLGAIMHEPPNGILGACVGLVAIFLPGFLALTAALPFWDQLRTRSWSQAAMRGANAAVVGILASALYDPVWVSAVHDGADVAAALAGFILLMVVRTPPIVVVILCAGFGVARTW
jgi:chromate transporter